MKFDIVIIGGGLAGMTAGIRMAEQGRKVALVSAGGNSLMFNTGSFGLLGFDNEHQVITDRAEALAELPSDHPYSRLEKETIHNSAAAAHELLGRCGLSFHSKSPSVNHSRFSPLGIPCPAWLTLDGMLTDILSCEDYAVLGLAGFLDFYPRFIAAGLKKKGCTCSVSIVDTSDLRQLRASQTEMRAVNIARHLHGDALSRLADEISKLKIAADTTIILPAVVGMKEREELIQRLDCQVVLAPTLGVSVPGLYIHQQMLRYFKSLGGRVFNGHRVDRAVFDKDKLVSVSTDKLDDDRLVAANYILASGSFFSRGLIATPTAIVEPTIGLDTVSPGTRGEWFADNFFAGQAAMKSGVVTYQKFLTLHHGQVVRNLYAIGSVLAGADSVHEESGAGVAMLTAMTVADAILNED